MKSVRNKLLQARVNLVMDQPFFGSLVLRLPLQEDPTCKTMYTNGRVIGYNPAEVEKWSVAEIQGTLCHEVLHIANGHIWRRDAREPEKWNQATDYSINPIVKEAGMLLPCGGGLDDPQFHGMPAEQIYSHLPDPPPGGEGGEGEAVGGPGEVRDDPDPDKAAEHQADWEVAVRQAATSAKAMGKLPAGLERLVEEILKPKVDWRALLHRFVQQCAREDYSWKIPNRRYVAHGLYLPGLRSEQMPPIVIGVDTSGSIQDSELSEFHTEIASVIAQIRPQSTHVVYCDAAVSGTQEFNPDEPVVLKPSGGGGTSFVPVFQWVEKEGIIPACLIYLTDMMGSFPEAPPDYPVLWIATTGAIAPFGETVRLEL